MTFSCCRIISTRAIERGSRIKRNDLRIWVSGDLVALFSFRSPITAPGPLLENEKRLFAMGNNAVPYTTLRVSRFVRCALVVVLRAVLRKCLEVADPERRRKSGWKQGAGCKTFRNGWKGAKGLLMRLKVFETILPKNNFFVPSETDKLLSLCTKPEKVRSSHIFAFKVFLRGHLGRRGG
jgi:hypothetical protein